MPIGLFDWVAFVLRKSSSLTHQDFIGIPYPKAGGRFPCIKKKLPNLENSGLTGVLFCHPNAALQQRDGEWGVLGVTFLLFKFLPKDGA